MPVPPNEKTPLGHKPDIPKETMPAPKTSAQVQNLKRANSEKTLKRLQEQSRLGNNYRPRVSDVPDTKAVPSKQNETLRKRTTLRLHSAIVSIPHPAKRATHGEDASFQTSTAVGVFDGVGSWRRRRVNSGNYSRKLAQLVNTYLMRHRHAAPHRALADAVSRNVLPGSCTATILSIYKNETFCALRGVNVGDGQLVVIRNGSVAFQTSPQQHTFNVPFQVSFSKRQDLLAAQHFEFQMMQGDIIVLATDGLWDNVFMSDIIEKTGTVMKRPSIVFESLTKGKIARTGVRNNSFVTREQLVEQSQKTRNNGEKLQTIGRNLAHVACNNAHHKSFISPFAHKARRLGKRFSGGKLDDITIAVAQPVFATEDVCLSSEITCAAQAK